MTFYHTSPNLITEIKESELFGSFLFFSAEIYEMSDAKAVYSIEIENERILEASQIFYHNDYEKLSNIVAHVMNICNVDEEEAQDLLSQQSQTGDAEKDWWIQGQSAECARILGFSGVSMRDEQGTCYMIDMKKNFNDLKLIETR